MGPCNSVSFLIHQKPECPKASSQSPSRSGDRLEAASRCASGSNDLSRDDKRTIGRDIAKVQFGWPVGLPLCRSLSGGLWELRSSLPSKREARVFFGFHDGMLIALHAIFKKTQKTPAGELALAKQRLKEMQSWQ